jgi:hypothetical protein
LVFETTAVEPVSGNSHVSKVFLDFDFSQTVSKKVNYTFFESILELICIFPFFMFAVLFLHSLVSLIVFYKDFAKMAQNHYFKVVELQIIDRLQLKFNRIVSAIEGMVQF